MTSFFQGPADIRAIDAVDLSSTDATLGNVDYLRVKGAGNLIVRAPNSAADTTIPANDGEYVPVGSGTVVRKTGTTVTSLVAFGR